VESSRHEPGPDDQANERDLTPLHILDVRFAQGELSIDDYNARRALQSSH
jgi:uncharacterized membrane protein